MILHKFQWNDDFSQDYYENGPAKKVSLYENYHWIPEVSFPMACALKTMYPNCSVLDFGCAKGYLVHALRLLGVEAYGFEVSRYAISQVPESIVPFIYTPDTMMPRVDVAFVKDTLEHLDENEISATLNQLRDHCHELFAIVPFGDNFTYRIKEYEHDVTHKIRRNETWWKYQFECADWNLKKFSYRVKGFKDKWHGRKYGNGFFTLEKRERGTSW